MGDLPRLTAARADGQQLHDADVVAGEKRDPIPVGARPQPVARALDPGMDGAGREREPALDDSRRRMRPRRRCSHQRSVGGDVEVSGRRVGVGEVDDEYLADRFTGRRDDRSLEGERPLLSAAVGAAVSGGADPGLLAGAADRVAAAGRLVVEIGDEDTPGAAVVVPGMGARHDHRPTTDAHPHRAEIALVPIGSGRHVEERVFIGEAH